MYTYVFLNPDPELVDSATKGDPKKHLTSLD